MDRYLHHDQEWNYSQQKKISTNAPIITSSTRSTHTPRTLKPGVDTRRDGQTGGKDILKWKTGTKKPYEYQHKTTRTEKKNKTGTQRDVSNFPCHFNCSRYVYAYFFTKARVRWTTRNETIVKIIANEPTWTAICKTENATLMRLRAL